MNKNQLKSLLLILIATILPQLATAFNFLVDGIAYNYNNDGTSVTVTDGGNYTGAIDIPSSVTENGTTYSVTMIGDFAFNYCSNLISVTIPNSVTMIGEWAFNGCSGLTSVDIPNSVVSIGRGSFSGCTGLTSVIIPNSVISIGSAAFSDCRGLTSVTIPNSVTDIGGNAFRGCSGLTNIYVNSNNVTYDSRDNCNAIIETATNTLITGCMNTVIPNSVTSIGRGSFFACTGLALVIIPNSVTEIGGDAFYGCTGLTSVIIPNSVTEIGGDAFYGCTGLTSVTIPNSVNGIGERAFRGCTGLTSVTIPNSVTTIGEWAFGCSGLTSVTIPNSVTSIGGLAFLGCGDLISIKVANGNTIYDSRDSCNAIIETWTNKLILGCKNTIITNSVASIGSYAFYGCSGLTSVTIPYSVTSIGTEAFSLSSGLTSVNIPNSVTSIGNSAFYGCTGLENVYTDVNPYRVTLGPLVFYRVTMETCVLHVEKEYLHLFKTADQWKDFYNIVGDYSAINTVKVDNGIRVPVGYYDINGVLHSEPVSGVNIIKYNDGAFEKKLMK